MDFRAVVVYGVIFCLCIGLKDCLGGEKVYCYGNGEICQNAGECCAGLNCKKPPHTCGGVCASNSCSGSGTNRPIGMQCDEYSNQCAPNPDDGSPVPCQRPSPKRCGEVCPPCAYKSDLRL